MKKILLTGMLFLGLGVKAQLPAGSIAPDFTLTDINGTSHNLYTYLNAGKTVFLDISATWCEPCWDFHQTGVLEELWVAHGPAGGLNVSAGTTDDVIVIFIEGDGTTTTEDLHGTGTNTMGDWVTGVSHPIIDEASAIIDPFNTDYAIGYFPTIYKICPNRQINEATETTSAELYASVASCPALSGVNNPSLISYNGETASCSAIDVIVTMQNLGSAILTAATIEIMDGSTTLVTYNWTGSLATLATEQVTIGSVTPTTPTEYTIVITSLDDVPSNNTITQTLSNALAAATASVTVAITTDEYGSETTWTLANSAGTSIASGGPYTDGTTTQTPVIYAAPTPDECYTLTVLDTYGDGMGTTGMVTITDGASNVLITTGTFTTTTTGNFKSGSGGSTGEIEEKSNSSISVYPNPVTENLNINFDAISANYTLSILDLTGRTITKEKYEKLSGKQTLSIPVNGISAGNYILKITSDKQTLNTPFTIK